MAEIELERKKSGSGAPWWILVALVVVGLLVWAVWPDDEETLVAGDDIEQVAPAAETGAEPLAADAGMPVADIVGDPVTWAGQDVSGEVTVVEVPTDRGFWIENNGQRVFVLMHVDGRESPPHVQANSTVRIAQATVHGADEIAGFVGELDAETRSILEGQQVFLSVEPRNVQVM